MSSVTTRVTVPVLGAPIDVISWDKTLTQLEEWAARHESRVVCACNVHSVVNALTSDVHRDALATADLATADGMPIVWALRLLGFPNQPRISGPDLMERFCARAAQTKGSIFLYGSTPETLRLLCDRLETRFPGLRIGGAYSPPFRDLSAEEDDAVVREIHASGANVVLVGLGCPKQEAWMTAHRGRIRAVMLGVGAAFDFHAGVKPRPPIWMQRAGLEWFCRLMSEPRRLWKRYFVTNTIFIVRFSMQLARHWRSRAANEIRW
jgi:N-acetylglucosaminyldiphosphoundecaprenol N-acetyl-beta-D-mannosaminyltransferase